MATLLLEKFCGGLAMAQALVLVILEHFPSI